MRPHYAALCCLLAASWQSAFAQSVKYRLGNTGVTETNETYVIQSRPPLKVTKRPGGGLWPALRTDESGNIYVGNKIVDSRTQQVKQFVSETLVFPYGVHLQATRTQFRFSMGRRNCTFSPGDLGLRDGDSALGAIKNESLLVATSTSSVVTLAGRAGDEADSSAYSARLVDLSTCRVDSVEDLGSPDMLIELGASPKGGFWITGSLEQTVLHSTDGKSWTAITVPDGLSSLISAYFVDQNEIWLAAVWNEGIVTNPYLLIHSTDGGKTWRNLVRDDPLLARVPPMWIEAQSRIATARCETQPCFSK